MQNNFSHPLTKAIFVGCVRALLFRVHFFRLEIEKSKICLCNILGLVLILFVLIILINIDRPIFNTKMAQLRI